MLRRIVCQALACSALLWGAQSHAQIALFAPPGVHPEFVGKVATAHINVHSPKALEKNLQAVKGSATRLDLDLGPILNGRKPLSQVRTRYRATDDAGGPASWQKKAMAPLAVNKLRVIPSDAQARKILRPYMAVIQRYQAQVATVFIADEPYLHGIPKADLERMAITVRQMFKEYGIQDVKLGLIFASGMVNAEFAQMVDQESLRYVQNIDAHRKTITRLGAKATAAERQWLKDITRHRLTTYDNAGNLYTGGGVPRGYDLYGFDFYLSTALQDRLYENMLPLLKKQVQGGECDISAYTTMSELRAQLSFYQDGPVRQPSAADKAAGRPTPQQQDKHLLDQLYQCRMTAATEMLRKELAKIGSKGKILVLTESSNNGVLEFDARQNIEKDQPERLIESRVLDEVQRGLDFYQAQRKNGDIAALEFFTFDNTFDKTIQLDIGGFVDMPAVKNLIFDRSQREMCQSGVTAACQKH
ncbi:hypothetical protein [Comamonas sp. JUb58]|uniref:hypothetical protein n=1 Tax=Comamonas sp. JUb58 TaxID=2485114 RepID=UPI0010615E0C|nr:hypothetical protein [Comamonas sp. JUb58]TDS82458.1 hypothetical protein EDF71_10793 [Comamonas sp. JUb58]